MKKNLLMCLLLFYGCIQVTAQSKRTITGSVRSADHQPLPGVNVIVKGTTYGTTTDAEGKYTIQASEHDMLVFSFIGYSSVEIPVQLQTNIDIELTEDIATLKEVIVVSTGYQQIPKERSTGSFAQLDNNLLNRRVSTDLLARVEDVTSGLIFNRNVEGKKNDISIRGMSTIHSNAQPLIVIDNFPYDGDLNTINPNDVESITILKDAAAASIWGTRAGNGVIVITTKKGKANKPLAVSINSNVTLSEKPDLFYAPQISSRDFIDVEKMLFNQGYYTAAEASANHAPLTPAVEMMIAHREGLISDGEMEAGLDLLRKQDVRKDFEKYFYRNAIKQQYAINLNGGSKANRYFVSAGWDRNLDDLVGNEYDRVTFNANHSWSALHEKLEISAGVYYSESRAKQNNTGIPGTRFTSTSRIYPYATLKDESGNNLPLIKDYRKGFVENAEADGLLNWQYNPIEEINLRDNTTRLNDYRINSAISYKVMKGLRAEVLYQYWKSINEHRDHKKETSYYSRNLINQYTQDNGSGVLTKAIPQGGILDVGLSTSVSHNLRTQMTYTKDWNAHAISALAGYEVREVNTAGNSFRYYGYNDDLATTQIVDYVSFFTRYDNPGSIALIPNADRQTSLTDRFLSYYANAAYTYKRRYIISGSGRKDQSNLFGVDANQRGVPLWSTGVGWNISEEPFYNFGAVPFVKLRATYGYNGNINKDVTALTTAYRVGYDLLTGLPYATLTNPPNKNLRWEKVNVLNLGLDFGLKGDAVNGSVEYFVKRGTDLIGTSPFAPSTGITEFTGNAANTRGRGVDVVLNSLNINRTLKWNTNFLFSYLSEKVTTYKVKTSAAAYMIYGSGASGTARPLEGKPLYSIFSYSWAGLNPETGDPRSYVDGVASTDFATIVSAATPESIVYNGPARPTMFGAVRNSVTWKNISLSFNISYRLGYYFRRSSIRYNNLLAGQPEHGDYANRWQAPGDDTNVPSLPSTLDANRDNVYLYSEVLVEKGDHIRLQDINLGYSFNKVAFKKMPFENAQLYIYANNLGLLWKATPVNIDPDYPTLKPLRSIAVGIKIDF